MIASVKSKQQFLRLISMHSQRFAIRCLIVTSMLRITSPTPGASYSKKITRWPAICLVEPCTLLSNPPQIKSRASHLSLMATSMSFLSIMIIGNHSIRVIGTTIIKNAVQLRARWMAVLIFTTTQKILIFRAWFSHYSLRQLVLRRALHFRVTSQIGGRIKELKLTSYSVGTI